ncbi:N-6 DNA methylase [Micromonospora globbae]|uniref:N-6 DNA methylase n=1 Tax=Micromonospora globbae TaxID=1894969 RepID=UPI001315A065|nr:N-6 DNA methylase [Micromonospora globbae]
MPDNGKFVDEVFRDPSVRHGLRIFPAESIDQLIFEVRNGKLNIRCFATNRWRLAKPEEVIRQLTVLMLSNQYGYPIDRISVEVPVKMGSSYAAKKADIVVYRENAKLHPHIVVEVKKPRRRDGLEQLNSYMNATGVYFGAWINGDDAVFQWRNEPNLFEQLHRLPASHESLDDVKQPMTKGQLRPLLDLRDEVEYLEDTVLANAGVSAFEEIFKLIFTKLYDEFEKAETDPVEFRTTTAPAREQYERLNSLFHRACEEWPDIFAPTENLELTPEALISVASALQTRRLLDADLDVIDAAFEYMINPEQKGDKGQYFTPRSVVKMCVKMLNPKPGERVIDPSCGPGGFLVHSLQWVTDRFLREKFARNLEKRKYDYAGSRLFGIDFDPRLVRVAKAMLLISGDGKTNIFRVNSLDLREWRSRTDGLEGRVKDGTFDIILTNPPFAGSITQPEILGSYDLAYKGDPTNNKRSNRMTRDVLFIERCMRLLRPGGRMAIVLPQGNFNNANADYIREWLFDQARILGVVSLHPNTFKPFTGTKTSVLVLQKRKPGESTDESEPIFMAINELPVKNNSGDYLYRVTDGEFDLDEDGKRIVADDLDEIADAFIAHARAQNLSFWSESD